jgi:hypothetical protein
MMPRDIIEKIAFFIGKLLIRTKKAGIITRNFFTKQLAHLLAAGRGGVKQQIFK